MSDEAFRAFLDRCSDELQEKQAVFVNRFEPKTNWRYDLDTTSLSIGRLLYPITAIGTHSGGHQTWLWAWANESFPAAARADSASLKSLYDLTGFAVFDDPGVSAGSTDAQDFSALAIHLLDAIGLFRSVSDDTTLYLAVHDPDGRR